MKHAIFIGFRASNKRLRTDHRAYPLPHSRFRIRSADLSLALAPDFPEMQKFLVFWQANLDGPLHSVRYTHQRLIRPNEWRSIAGEFKLH